MSDSPPAITPDEPTPPADRPHGSGAAAKDDAPKPPRKPRTWRRRIGVLLLVLLVVGLALRATLYWTLPMALSRAAAGYDLDVRYDRQQIHLIGGDVGLWNFRAVPRGAP